MVDSLTVPGFKTDKSGLKFGLSELKHGSSALLSSNMDNDFCLRVTVKVRRDSGKLADVVLCFLPLLFPILNTSYGATNYGSNKLWFRVL
jgi:hypothetical protein